MAERWWAPRSILGSAAAATVATALFAAIGAITIPGTTTAASTTAVSQAPATSTTHAVSGGSG